MDKLESCMVRHYCMNGNCTTDTATKMVNFLGCFENDHGDSKSVQSAQGCAGAAQLDFDPIQICYNDRNAKEEAYQTIIDAAKEGPWFQQMKCTPWVVVGEQLFSNPSILQCVQHGDASALIKAVCNSYNGSAPVGCRKKITGL